MSQGESTFELVCQDIIKRLRQEEVSKEDVESIKLDVCGEWSAERIPKNSELLDRIPDEAMSSLKPLLQKSPMRTASGVTPVAIMTSPHMCPHGKCLYCPGGPASEYSSAQAYTGKEPAGRRAQRNEYDPYAQVTDRLSQFARNGHPTDKVELILMGGTMTARSHDYQEWFVKRALRAMNDFNRNNIPEGNRPEDLGFEYVENVKSRNESADVRCIGITFETKPDWCDPEQIDRMLRLGGTKVEVGVQTTYERINREMHRGHGTQASIDANRRLRDAGFKVGFHMMPGQPGMTKEMCREDFRQLFSDSRYRPDYLKIYPTLVTKGTRVYDQWCRDEYEPLTSEEAAELIAEVKAELPKYVRLQRVQRDIPADEIDAGVQKSNLRQLAWSKMADGEQCDCIRCREIGHTEGEPEEVVLDVETYEAAGGTEHFISFVSKEGEILLGFCRLRFPDNPRREELRDAALVRELHVYGSEAAIGEESGEGWQHRGLGTRLMNRAEELAKEAGYEKVVVISGIGAREYYRTKLGYRQDGPYVSKPLPN